MPTSIEMISPVRTTKAICLMVFFAIHVLEDVRTRLPFFDSYLIHFLVFYTTPHLLSVVFSQVSSIAFGTYGDMRVTAECQMAPFPAVLALQNTWVLL